MRLDDQTGTMGTPPPSAFSPQPLSLLPSAFCLQPSAFSLLPSALCLQPSAICYAPQPMALFSKDPPNTPPPSRPLPRSGDSQPVFNGTYFGPNVTIDGTVTGSE